MIHVEHVSKADWECMSHDAHLAVFDEVLPPEMENIDFALLAVNSINNVPLAYLTARILDKESVYLKYGGSFPPARNTMMSYKCYLELLKVLKHNYLRITTLVENTNTVYLKMALSAGFVPIGMRNFKGQTFLELLLEGK